MGNLSILQGTRRVPKEPNQPDWVPGLPRNRSANVQSDTFTARINLERWSAIALKSVTQQRGASRAILQGTRRVPIRPKYGCPIRHVHSENQLREWAIYPFSKELEEFPRDLSEAPAELFSKELEEFPRNPICRIGFPSSHATKHRFLRVSPRGEPRRHRAAPSSVRIQ